MGELEIRSSTDEAHREPGFLDLTGREIGRYRIQQRLGRGGVTTVYQAYDSVDDMPVALKVLLHGSDTKLYNRFRQEAQTAAKLRHSHIVRTLRVGVTPGTDTAYIAMELVEGEDLAALLARHRRLSPEESCLLLEPIAHALAYAHTQQVIHRDVKPSNILLRTVGGEFAGAVVLEALDYPVVPLLGDFGIARALDSPELTSWGRTVGTPAFMAPEQARGARNVDHRADIYALGAVFYRCITGRQPFTGTTVQILHAHVYDSVTITDEVQRNLSQRHMEILQRTLAKDPNDRYATAAELAQALARGANPAADLLTASEREENPTITLEIHPAEVPSATGASVNVIIPGMNHSVPSPVPAAVPSGSAGSPTSIEQQPLDPNFNPELDRKLQRVASIIFSVLLTFIAVAILIFLLRSGSNPENKKTEPTTPVPTVRPAAVGMVPTSATGDRPRAVLPSTHIGGPSLGSASQAHLYRTVPRLLIPIPPTALLTPTIASVQSLSPPQVEAAPNAHYPLGDVQRLDAYVGDVTEVDTSLQAQPPPSTTQHLAVSPTDTPMPTDSPPTGNTILSPTENWAESAIIHAPCVVLMDSRLQPYILETLPYLQEQYRCPSDIPIIGMGAYLVFAHGYMIYLRDVEQVFVAYATVDETTPPWELFPAHPEILVEGSTPGPTAPEDMQFYPSGIFGDVWSLGTNRQRLGMAKMPQPNAVAVTAQPFHESWLLLQSPPDAPMEATLHVFASAHNTHH